jgi:hypothetical protein
MHSVTDSPRWVVAGEGDDPDEYDPHEVERESPSAEPDTPSAEADSAAALDHDCRAYSDAERVAYIAKFPARVAAEYEVAWDAGVPAFRASWAEHEEKYPHPERSRPTVEHDGSWRAKDDLKLSPEQNAEVDRSNKRDREIGENVIIPGMWSMEAEDTNRRLVGFDRRFKELDRLKEKVADQLRSTPGLTPTQALALIPDAIRFTLSYPYESYATGVRKDIERLEARGFIQEERRNTWASEQYKGINSRWREPVSGLLFEVQFHTRISSEAKELTHKAYERIRSGAGDSERTDLKEFQRRVCATVPIPPGTDEIEDYLREKHDG